MTHSKRREERFLVRLSGAEKRALYRLAAAKDIPASQIVRLAVKRAIASCGVEESVTPSAKKAREIYDPHL
jgi:hypothetical protein